MLIILDLKKVLGVTLYYDASQTPTQPFEMEMEVEPGGKSGMHVHPQQDEFFHVSEGELQVYLNGKWESLGSGGEVLIPTAAQHGFRNTGIQKVVAHNKHIPGLRIREYFETMHKLIKEGKVTGMAGFKNSIYLSLLVLKYPDIIKLSKPPDAFIKAAAFMGKILGFKI